MIKFQVGKEWKDVINSCVAGRFQPSILFFEAVDTKHHSMDTGDPSCASISSLTEVAAALSPVEMFEREFVFSKRELTTSVWRNFEAFKFKWKVLMEKTDDEYVSATVRRSDQLLDSITVSIQFECRLYPVTFTSKIASVEMSSGGSWSDPYFLCPKRQKLYENSGKIGLCITMWKLELSTAMK